MTYVAHGLQVTSADFVVDFSVLWIAEKVKNMGWCNETVDFRLNSVWKAFDKAWKLY